MIRLSAFLVLFAVISCSSASSDTVDSASVEDTTSVAQDSITEEADYCNASMKVGAERTDVYLKLLEGKSVAVVGNQSSMVGNTQLVDTLQSLGVSLVKIFTPEHGFRGKADAGEKVNDEIDEKTGLPLVSLYGKNRKPTAEQLADVDVVLFDLQDVGARFYTYISTLTYVMDACAENMTKVIVLDRPNPNGHYVAGPVLDPNYSSFVGMHEVPVVHGMTMGEYAKMVDGEGWIDPALGENLTVITCDGWDHTKFYEVPIAPSPNLPNMTSIYLYPSLCLFEGTVVSVGRGTDAPFQQIGHPDFEVDILEDLNSFKPEPNEGSSSPKLNGKTCHGYSFADLSLEELRAFGFDLKYLLEFYSKLNSKDFFLSNGFINNLAGSADLKSQIVDGKSLEEIEKSWQPALDSFKKTRSKYLLYTDFN